jgi:hypothetical protein
MPLTKEQILEARRAVGLRIDSSQSGVNTRMERLRKIAEETTAQKDTKNEIPTQTKKPVGDGFFSQLYAGKTPSQLDVKGIDPLAYPKQAIGLGIDTIRGASRLLARPFVETVRGVRGVVPGGKTGEEPISVPGLGEFEKPTIGSGLLEAGEAALTFLPAEKLLSPIMKQVGKVKNIDEAISKLVGKITNGNPKEIKRAKEAFKTLDTSGIKTYSDLTLASNDAIKTLAKSQDELLDGIKNSYDINSFTKKIADTEQNHIKDAFNNLEEHYRRSNNLEKLDELLILKKKAESGGITLNEINSLARKYSTDMPDAFLKTGESSTSITKQAFENTRSGLKDTFRNTLPDGLKEQSILLDEQMSNLFRLKDLSVKMEDKVQKLYNRVEERGLFERLSRKLGQAADVLTLRTVSGFTKAFVVPSNVGLKTMNSIDLEKQLAKNLSKLDDLLSKNLSDEKFLSELEQIILQNITIRSLEGEE